MYRTRSQYKKLFKCSVYSGCCEISNADAVHPGYGFLSENADFAEICGLHGLVFIGPKPEHIRALGNKVAARAVAEKAGVPMLPGSKGRVSGPDEAESWRKILVFPLIIKAAAGGGGRGMKIVKTMEELHRLFPLAQTGSTKFFCLS